jgi:hypothetical protein
MTARITCAGSLEGILASHREGKSVFFQFGMADKTAQTICK